VRHAPDYKYQLFPSSRISGIEVKVVDGVATVVGGQLTGELLERHLVRFARLLDLDLGEVVGQFVLDELILAADLDLIEGNYDAVLNGYSRSGHVDRVCIRMYVGYVGGYVCVCQW